MLKVIFIEIYSRDLGHMEFLKILLDIFALYMYSLGYGPRVDFKLLQQFLYR